MTQAIDPFSPVPTVRDGSGTIIQEASVRPDTPKTTPILPDTSKSFSAIVQIAKDVLINPDVAVRTDYRLADQMLRDPMVMSPLQKRMLAAAQLPWEIVPENPGDQRQKDICANLTRIVKRIPRLQEFFRTLGMAVFRGTGVSELNWVENADSRQWEIDNHRPHHGDKITYDIWGNPRMLTRDHQTGGRQLDKAEKDRMVIHTFDREDGEFYDGAQAGYVYKGRGVRDVIWPYWFLKINATRFWVTLLERFGTGWVEGRFPMGNAKAKMAIESVLQNLVNDSKYSLPVPDGVDMVKGNYGITVHKLDGIGESAKLFTDFVEGWAGKHIRMVIEGQEQAQQEGGDGLGSGRAEALADIFRMYRDYDAGLMEDTMTDQLLAKLVFFNYGRLEFRPLFHFITEKANYDDQMKRVNAAKAAGMRVPRRWLNETLDVPELTGEELPDEIVDFGAQALGQMGGGAGDSLFMEGHEPQGMREMFREAMGSRVLYTEGPHKFSTTQIQLDENAADEIRNFAATIPADELAEEGVEKDIHVTVKYGLHTNDPAELGALLANKADTITYSVGPTSLFPASKDRPYDVLKLDVFGDDLHRLNRLIADNLDNTEKWPEYNPHVTVAYLKPGMGEKYVGRSLVSDGDREAKGLIFSSRDGARTRIGFGAQKDADTDTKSAKFSQIRAFINKWFNPNP